MDKVRAARARLRQALAALPAVSDGYAMSKSPPPPHDLIDDVMEAMTALEDALRDIGAAKRESRRWEHHQDN